MTFLIQTMEPVPKLLVATSIIDESIGSVKNTIHACAVCEALEQSYSTKLRHSGIKRFILSKNEVEPKIYTSTKRTCVKALPRSLPCPAAVCPWEAYRSTSSRSLWRLGNRHALTHNYDLLATINELITTLHREVLLSQELASSLVVLGGPVSLLLIGYTALRQSCQRWQV
jgi:hypothetical protein